MQYIIIVFSIIVSLYPIALQAAPSISGVSGTVSNGQSVTISGSGFGSTGPVVDFFESFENGTVGENVSLVANSADIGEWAKIRETGEAYSTYSTAYAHGGSKSLQVDWRPPAMWGGGPVVNFSDTQSEYVLISWWQFLPTNRDVPGTNNPQDGGANWKWFWMGDRNDGWPMGSDYAGQQHYGFNQDGSTVGIQGAVIGHDKDAPARYDCGWYTKPSVFKKGTWMRLTMAMKNATSGGHIWQQEVSSDGHVIQFDVQNITTAHSDDPWNTLILPGFGRTDSNAVAYYDDVYIATGAGARARVEIGNASTYSASTKLALITPTSWGGTSIQATVRSGSFANGSAYLYVIDASGIPNALGFPITIGGGGVMSWGGVMSGGGYMR